MLKREIAKLILVAMLVAPIASGDVAGYDVGRAPSAADLESLTIMVKTNGQGLPAGSGTAEQGKQVFMQRCASCHGPTGEGGDGPALAGGEGTLASATPKRTVGSYWPYATTLWDYVNRAMPFDRPGTLSYSEVYAVSAYVLFINGLVDANTVIDAKSLPRIRMPNVDGFIADPRPDVKQ